MSIQSEVERISTNVQNTIDTIEQTGVTVPENANSDNLPALAQALANEKQNKLTGTSGQYVGFNSSGNAVAVDPPSSLPSGGSEGKLLGYGTEPEWVDSPVMYVEFTQSGGTLTCNHSPKEIVEAHINGRVLMARLPVVIDDAGGTQDKCYSVSTALDYKSENMYHVAFHCTKVEPDDPWETIIGQQQGEEQPVWNYVESEATITTTNKTVPTSAWSSDSTYTDLGFNYRASVSVSSVTTSYIPDVNFSPADQYSGNLASFADTYNGGVYIYAKTQPTETVTIESAIFTRS